MIGHFITSTGKPAPEQRLKTELHYYAADIIAGTVHPRVSFSEYAAQQLGWKWTDEDAPEQATRDDSAELGVM